MPRRSVTDWEAYARAAAQREGLDPDLFSAQIRQESNFNPDARSGAGAIGIAQIMPGTAAGWGVDPTDPRASLDAAAREMARYKKQYGSLRNALIAYNAGPGRVGKPLPAETQQYINIILGGKKDHGTGKPTAVGAKPQLNGQLQQMQAPQAPNYFAQIAQMTPVSVGGANPGLQQLQQTTQQNWAMMGQLQERMNQARQAFQQGSVPDAPTAKSLQDAPDSVMAMFEEAERIDRAQLPYSWGGGHDRARGANDKLVPLDCSGAVSQVLGLDPRVAANYMNWGKPGRGKNVTVYANEGHVLMEINGHFWGTSKSNPGGGAGWIPRSVISKDYLSRFTARHPQGM